jgi:Domain of unknown function (DUF927)
VQLKTTEQDTLSFFDAVLPAGGQRVVLAMRDKSGSGKLEVCGQMRCVDNAELYAVCTELDRQERQVYFALAGYNDSTTGRTKADTVAMCALWVDIDAGEDKFAKAPHNSYPSVKDAGAALTAFCADYFVEPTYVVKSGTGLHVYWALTEDVSPAVWQELATGLKSLARHADFKADPSRTSDGASVLRPPGTRHKNGAEVVICVAPEGTDDYRYTPAAIQAKLAETVVAAPVQAVAMPADRSQFTPVWYSNIRAKALDGSGCQQIRDLIASGGAVDEPLWRAGLSVIGAGEDTPAQKLEFIQEISKGDPRFNPYEALSKMNGATAATGCSRFKDLNAKGCEGCAFNGAVSVVNPAQTGVDITRSSKEIRAVEEVKYTAVLPTLAPIAAVVQALPQAEATEATDPFERTLSPAEQHSNKPRTTPFEFQVREAATKVARKIPGTDIEILLETQNQHNMPYVYVRGNFTLSHDATSIAEAVRKPRYTEGVALFYIDIDKETKERCPRVKNLCDSTVRATGRTNMRHDSDASFMLQVSIISRMDRPVLFSLPASTLVCRPEGVCTELASRGAMVETSREKDMQEYLARCQSDQKLDAPATLDQNHLGWTEDNTFFYGDMDITGNGKAVRMPAAGDRKAFYHMAKGSGTKADWLQMLRLMYPNDRATSAAYQFAVLSGFAAPLYSARESSDCGGVINYWSSGSGHGKTAGITTALAIYGDSKFLQTSTTSSAVAIYSRMSAAHSLPMLIDDTTTLAPDKLSTIVMDSTKGVGKDRMEQSGKSIQDNKYVWRSWAYMTANKSLVEILKGHNTDPEGFVRRTLEIEAPDVAGSVSYADSKTIETLRANTYGVVGPEWLDSLVTNRDSYLQRVKSVTAEFEQETCAKKTERYWIAMIGSILAAGEITQELGLHEFDMEAVRAFAVSLLNSSRNISNDKLDPKDVIADMYTSNIDKIFDVREGISNELQVPVKEIVFRLDHVPETTLTIVRTALYKESTRRNISNKAMHTFLQGLGAIERKKCILSKHESRKGEATIQQWCWVLDAAAYAKLSLAEVITPIGH